MKEKELRARLKEPPVVQVRFEADFEVDWIQASMLIEEQKRRLFSKLKSALHEKVAMLTLEDIEFQII